MPPNAWKEFFMANWNEVKSFLKSGLNAQETDSGNLTMTISYADKRSQLVIVQRGEFKGAEWIDIISGVGALSAGNINVALEVLANATCGGLVKFGDTHAVRHCIPIADVSNDELIVPLRVVAEVADLLEEKLVGGDNL
jgi:hypothetical protein